MTDPTPTTQTPPQKLSDEELLRLAAGEIEPYDRIEPGEYEAENECALEVYGSELIAAMRAAIAADRAARVGLPPNYIDPEHTGEDRKLLETFYVGLMFEGGTADEITLRGIRAVIAADRAARPQPAPEDVEARFRAWWAESYPFAAIAFCGNAPAGPHAVSSHVAFALHLLGGEVG